MGAEDGGDTGELWRRWVELSSSCGGCFIQAVADACCVRACLAAVLACDRRRAQNMRDIEPWRVQRHAGPCKRVDAVRRGRKKCELTISNLRWHMPPRRFVDPCLALGPRPLCRRGASSAAQLMLLVPGGGHGVGHLVRYGELTHSSGRWPHGVARSGAYVLTLSAACSSASGGIRSSLD